MSDLFRDKKAVPTNCRNGFLFRVKVVETQCLAFTVERPAMVFNAKYPMADAKDCVSTNRISSLFLDIYGMQGETQNVYKTYNKIAGWFSANRPKNLMMEKSYLDDLICRLPPDAFVLDLGCGTGEPILQYLIAQNIKVTGVDASSELLNMAKANFPNVPLILQDMRQLNLDVKFDAIIAWHSFFHLPADDQPAMFERFAKHLNTNGTLLFTSGTERSEARGENGGEQLFHASLDTAEYEALLQQNGFTILKHVVNDPDCGGATIWMAQYIGV